ncbi:hypothetical protein HDU76_000521, partial [Blyttiomyces sp. JEL0837]
EVPNFNNRRQVTTPNPIPDGCSLFTNSQLGIAQRLPGWNSFLNQVASGLGVAVNSWKEMHLGWDTFISSTNGVQTYLCPKGSKINWNWGLTNACNVNHNVDKFVGTPVDVTYTAKITTTLGVQTTMTHSLNNEFGLAFEAGGKFGLPVVAEGEVKTTVSWKINVGDAKAVTDSILVTQEIDGYLPYQHGANCSMDLSLQVCKYSGDGTLPILATGYVWFVFSQQVQGHWSWGFLLDAYLPNEEDRTYRTPVHSDVSSFGSGTAVTTCDNGSTQTGPNASPDTLPQKQAVSFIYQVPSAGVYAPIYMTGGNSKNVLDFPQYPSGGPALNGTVLILNPYDSNSPSQLFTFILSPDQYTYHIIHQQTGYCVDAPVNSIGAGIQLSVCDNINTYASGTQRWVLQSTSLNNGGFDVVNFGNGKCLTDWGGNRNFGDEIALYDCAASGQAWFVPSTSVPNLKWTFTLNGVNKRVLSFPTSHGQASPAGTPLQLASPDPGNHPSQQFKIVLSNDLTNYNILHLGTGYCVEVLNNGLTDGSTVVLNPCNPYGQDNQRWNYRPSAIGGFEVYGIQSDKCLNDYGGNHAVGDVIKIFDCASAGQSW